MNAYQRILVILWPTLAAQLFFLLGSVTTIAILKYGTVLATLPLLSFLTNSKRKKTIKEILILSLTASVVLVVSCCVYPFKMFSNFFEYASFAVPFFMLSYSCVLFVETSLFHFIMKSNAAAS